MTDSTQQAFQGMSTRQIVWAVTFAQTFHNKRDYDLATMKAAEAVTALELASANSRELKPGSRREMLELFTNIFR